MSYVTNCKIKTLKIEGKQTNMYGWREKVLYKSSERIDLLAQNTKVSISKVFNPNFTGKN